MKYAIRNPTTLSEVAAAIDILENSFPRLKKEYFLKRILGDPGYKKSHTFLLLDGKRIISHAQLFYRKVWWNNKKVKFIGLGAICTIPAFRRKGCASALIRHIIKDTDYSVLCLFTRIPEYYKEFGFFSVARERFILKKCNSSGFNHNYKNIRRFEFARDILPVIAVHRHFFSSYTGIAVREFKDWHSQFSYFNEEKDLFLVLELQHRINAYVRCRRHKDKTKKRIEIIEYADLNNDKLLLADFIAYLFRKLDAREISVNGAFLNKPVPSEFRPAVELDCLMMLKLADKFNFFKNSASEFDFLEADSF